MKPSNKKPRHYAEEIMRLDPSDRKTAIAAVPAHYAPIVESHIEIAEAMERHEIERAARKISSLESRAERNIALLDTRDPIRERVRSRAIELFEVRKKEESCAG